MFGPGAITTALGMASLVRHPGDGVANSFGPMQANYTTVLTARRPAHRLRTQHRPPTSFAEPAPRSASATLHERHALLDSGADRRGPQPLP